MSDNQNTQYTESIEARAEDVAEYFTSKPAEQIILGLLATAKKKDDLEAWQRLDEYVRECEKVRFDNENKPDEVADVF
jgi:hypothetical protein